MPKKTKKLTPAPEDSHQVKELSEATGGGMAQNATEIYVYVDGQRYTIYAGSYLTVRREGGSSWVCVWNETNEGEPNLKIRIQP